MLDNQHGVTALSELAQNGNQSFTVRHMQTRCRFIQHIEGFSGRCTGKLSRQLHALSLAAGECGRGLSQTDIAQAHIIERLQLTGDTRISGEEIQGFFNGHIQHVGDGFSLIQHF